MTITMFDSVDVSTLPAGKDFAYAGYVDGHFATYPKLKVKFPHSNLLSIAVFAHDDADCLDVEQGDATPAQAPAWVKRQKAPRPCLYASVSVMDSLISTLDRAGIARGSVRLWSAHYGNGEHICGPKTCNLTKTLMDGTQWTDHARGISLDQSLLHDDFFGGGGTADSTGGTVIPVTYQPVTRQLPVLQQGVSDTNLPHWYVRRVQAILVHIYGYQCAIDGEYGPNTAAAVKLFQRQYNLTEDGICGEKTWEKIIGG
jgi:peptidoglycan hydrolase-like protein with peptidoglycan-binding domain